MTLKHAEEIALHIQTRLQTLTIAQGAETDVGSNVWLGRLHVDDSMIPMVSLIEVGDAPTHVGPTTSVESTWEFVAYAYLPCDPANPSLAAHAAVRDMKRALFRTAGRPSRDWARLVRNVSYKGYEIGPRADGAAFVVAAVKFAVTSFEDVANP